MSFDFDSFSKLGQQRLAEGASTEELLSLFRQEGASMMDSTQLLMQVKDIPLREASELIHFSETWADLKESQEKLFDDFLEAARRLGAKVTLEEKR